MPLGEGSADLPSVFSCMKQIGYDRPVTLQVARGEDGDEVTGFAEQLAFVQQLLAIGRHTNPFQEPALKILMIGLGGIGQRHTRNLRRCSATRLRSLRTGAASYPRGHAGDGRGPGAQRRRCLQYPHLSLAGRGACRKTRYRVCVQSQQPARCGNTRVLVAGCEFLARKPLADSLEGTAELVDSPAGKGRIAWWAISFAFIPASFV